MSKTNLGALVAPLLALMMTLSSHAAPATPTTCKDGTTSTATGRGACSGHGGVQKATSAASKTAAAEAPAATSAAAPAAAASKAAPATGGNTDPTGATAKCKDGTYSKSKHHSGTCSKHGGVANWLDGK